MRGNSSVPPVPRYCFFLSFFVLLPMVACRKENWEKYDEWIVGVWFKLFYGERLYFSPDGLWYSDLMEFYSCEGKLICLNYDFCSKQCIYPSDSGWNPQYFKYHLNRDTLYLQVFGYTQTFFPDTCPQAPTWKTYIYRVKIKRKLSGVHELILKPLDQKSKYFIVAGQEEDRFFYSGENDKPGCRK